MSFLTNDSPLFYKFIILFSLHYQLYFFHLPKECKVHHHKASISNEFSMMMNNLFLLALLTNIYN